MVVHVYILRCTRSRCFSVPNKRFSISKRSYDFLFQYLGNTTPTVVKERIKELLYSWKMGLPHEPKINEAYLMLKREGLMFNENVEPDKTLEPDHVKPKISLIQDPKQSQVRKTRQTSIAQFSTKGRVTILVLSMPIGLVWFHDSLQQKTIKRLTCTCM